MLTFIEQKLKLDHFPAAQVLAALRPWAEFIDRTSTSHRIHRKGEPALDTENIDFLP